jgi:hypothetical protein
MKTAIVLVTLAASTAAQAANTTTLFARNYWLVTHMARNNEGRPMCLMTSQISFTTSLTNTGNAYVRIKWEKENQIHSSNWTK